MRYYIIYSLLLSLGIFFSWANDNDDYHKYRKSRTIIEIENIYEVDLSDKQVQEVININLNQVLFFIKNSYSEALSNKVTTKTRFNKRIYFNRLDSDKSPPFMV